MSSLNNAIILIGFKHVGKSVIGEQLAIKLQRQFIDLDHELEKIHAKNTRESLSCREIVDQYGLDYFMQLEHQALQYASATLHSVISLGGGAALNKMNQQLMKTSYLIHITAPIEIVYERIISRGIPTFFPKNENLREAFDRLWEERKIIYEQLTDFKINNDSTIQRAVNQILSNLR